MSDTRNNLICFILLFSMLLSRMTVGGFNLDTQFPVIFSGPTGSYFGYTVALHLKVDTYVVLVGAPTANSTLEPSVYKPGGLFWCNINNTLCEDVFQKESPLRRTLFSRKPSYRMWLGATLDVIPDFQRPMQQYAVVVCAHRNVRGPTSVNGLCCLLESNLALSVNSIIKPLDSSDGQYIYDSNENVYRSYYNNGQAGMSATFSKNGSRLIVGAPGIYEGMGSVFYYNGVSSRYSYQQRGRSVKMPPVTEKHSYFGYSITSGKFFDLPNDQYAVGAPRGESHGKVYIIATSDSADVSILQSEKGFQVGEYFGASVLGVNLNGDSFTDLVVGSPLYAQEMGCDEGKVTVYISDGSVLNLHSELYGDAMSDARFGSSIAAIGDLNADGYDDFAVGAPYEDGKGAVYIYQGSDSGVDAHFSQKIEAAEVHPDLVGFGIHISRGVDIDNNGYPDIAVGSYVSSHAVLLRARPVIDVSAEVHFNPPEIKMDTAECVYSGKNLPCVHVDCCLVYNGQQVPASLDFHCTLFEQDENLRGFFLPYRPKNAAVEMNFTLKSNTSMCLTKQFYLHTDIKDIITPIQMHFSCELAPSTASNDTFDRTYPVVSPYSKQSVTSQIPFHSGCANDDKCNSDLIVDVELLGEAKNGVITLGNVSSISMDITVRNDGEPAYSSILFIYIPWDIPIINKDFCGSRDILVQTIIACDLGNPLVKDKQVNVRIKLDVTKLASHTNIIEIFFEARTNSSETNSIDNQLNLSLEVKKISDIGIRGTPSHYLILHEEGHEMSSQITHKFTVRNYGPSPLQMINILLQVPHVIWTSGRIPLIQLMEIQTDGLSDNILPVACKDATLDIEMFIRKASKDLRDDSWENETIDYNESSSPTASSNHVKRSSVFESGPAKSLINAPSKMELSIDSREERSFQISCDDGNFECIALHCSAAPFSDIRKFAEISVTFKLNYTTLNNYFGKWHQIKFITRGSISISDDNVFHLPHHSNVTLVKTVLYNDDLSPMELPHWLFSVGAFIGSMLLFQIIIILIKVGFFRRKEKEILERLEQSFAECNTEEDMLINPSDDSSAESE